MKWYAAIFGLHAETTEINVDFPTLGNPTNPTSANTFNSTRTSRFCPNSPFSASSGAVLRGVAKWIFPRPPRPPFAIIAR